MKLTADLLQACTGATIARASDAVGPANEVIALYGLSTVNRVGMWLANVGHETGGLQWKTELWGPTDVQSRYEGRLDLGNTVAGDGFRFRGRGWLQTTGRANYTKLTQRLRGRWPQMQVPDFVSQPDMLAQTEWCAVSAADFWDMRNLNRWADADNFDAVCDIINRGHVTALQGDSNGFTDRLALWSAAKPALILAGFPTEVPHE